MTLKWMKGIPLMVLSLACAATSVEAASPTNGDDIDQSLAHCLADPDKKATGDQDACIDTATRAWDDRLNATYQALQRDLPDASRPVLVAAQRAWVASRDADLKLIAAVYGTVHGTMYAPMNANDVMSVTRRRAQTLMRYFSVVSGAPSAMPPVNGWPLPVALERPDGGSPVPQRGLRFELANCVKLTEAGAIARCAKQSTPRYARDITVISTTMARRMPAASRGTARVAAAQWRRFMTAEAALADAVCPDSQTPQGQACRALQARNDTFARLQWLVGLEGMIGAN
ncbi:lysozyme inhibitor LprI family protein [Pandoraea pnomenusa]|uniref:lysozyme inhibitor LprI family protein n=1 Tax=Pandoraea pnomenusa TaxID=93220 RepID=UPI003342682D